MKAHSRKEYLLCSGDKLTCEACAAYLLQSGIHPEPSQLDRIEESILHVGTNIGSRLAAVEAKLGRIDAAQSNKHQGTRTYGGS